MNSTTKNFPRHPLSAAFPGMEATDYEQLVADIEANGLLQPIVIYDGMVLDGWHRYQASLDAGVKPRFEDFTGPDPVAFVLSLNMHRRHLTGSQRAAAVVACNTWARPGNQPKGEVASPLATVEDMAETARVSERTIQHAKRAQEAGLGEEVRDGKITAEQAARVAKLPEPDRQAALEAPKPKPAHQEDNAPLHSRISELEALLAERDGEIAELTKMLEETVEDNKSMSRILDAEDLQAAYQKEVKRYQELARVTEARNNALISEVNELKGFCKMWKGKFERLEKATKLPLVS